MDFSSVNNGFFAIPYESNSNTMFYGQARESCLSSKDIEILQLKTRIKSLEHALSQRDLCIKMLEYELRQKQEMDKETEIIRKDLMIQMLEHEIDEKEESIEVHKENFDDLCDKTGYECLWEREIRTNEWTAYNEEISQKIEKMDIEQNIEYKLKNGDFVVITKLNNDCGIEQNEFDGNKKYIRRRERFCAIEKKEKLISTQQQKIKSLTVKMEEMNEKIGYVVNWEWMENEKKSQWVSYNETVCQKIESMEVKEQFEYNLNKNQIYIITKTAIDCAEQINKATKFKRSVRRIERYQKLECLNGKQMNYPSFWNMASQIISEYAKPKLINIAANNDKKSEYFEISKRFYQSVSRNEYEIVRIEGVQNQMLYDKYCSERESVYKVNGQNGLNEKYLFHGTKREDTMRAIETEGFRKEFSTTHAYGYGTYFAKNAKYSISYCAKNNGIYQMFECKVICGQSHIGNSAYSLRTWPKTKSGFIYDSLVDSMHSPTIFVIHQNARAYPMHIIHFKRKNSYW